MALDLYQLKIFFSLSSLLHYTEAAKRLHLTQSAVSHAIKKLEENMGLKLFNKGGKRVYLTEAGQMLAKSCNNIFHEIEKIEENLKTGNFQENSIKLGCTVEFGTSLLIKHFKPFFNQNNLTVDFYFSHELFKPLFLDELDLIIECKKNLSREFVRIPLFTEEYLLVCTPEYKKEAKLKKTSDLEMATFLSLDKEGIWWEKFKAIPIIGEKTGLKKIMQINHIRGMINGALCSLGVLLVPKYAILKELESGALINLFPKIKIPADEFAIYIKPHKTEMEKYIRLIEYLKNLKLEDFQ